MGAWRPRPLLLAASTFLLVALRGRGVPLAVYGYATFVMVTLNGNLVAVHRYLLPALGVYVALAVLADRGPRGRLVASAHAWIGLLLQAVLFAMFVATMWAG